MTPNMAELRGLKRRRAQVNHKIEMLERRGRQAAHESDLRWIKYRRGATVRTLALEPNGRRVFK